MQNYFFSISLFVIFQTICIFFLENQVPYKQIIFLIFYFVLNPPKNIFPKNLHKNKAIMVSKSSRKKGGRSSCPFRACPSRATINMTLVWEQYVFLYAHGLIPNQGNLAGRSTPAQYGEHEQANEIKNPEEQANMGRGAYGGMRGFFETFFVGDVLGGEEILSDFWDIGKGCLRSMGGDILLQLKNLRSMNVYLFIQLLIVN